jgi:methionyl-tRNA synthetase
MENNLLEWLDEWYESNCDGDWEHYYGIKIVTLDNPGWDVTIDLESTNVDLTELKWYLIEFNSEAWVGFEIKKDVFRCSSIPNNLKLVIFIFKTLVEKGKISDEEIFKFYKDSNKK